MRVWSNASASSSLRDFLEGWSANKKNKQEYIAHESVLSLTMKVNAPKNLTLSASFPSRLLASCHPSGDRWRFCKASWVFPTFSEAPGWYSWRTNCCVLVKYSRLVPLSSCACGNIVRDLAQVATDWSSLRRMECWRDLHPLPLPEKTVFAPRWSSP